MEVFLIKLAQLILALSILILLHEGGHFFFAKLFGVRVEKFYMFFGPLLLCQAVWRQSREILHVL